MKDIGLKILHATKTLLGQTLLPVLREKPKEKEKADVKAEAKVKVEDMLITMHIHMTNISSEMMKKKIILFTATCTLHRAGPRKSCVSEPF